MKNPNTMRDPSWELAQYLRGVKDRSLELVDNLEPNPIEAALISGAQCPPEVFASSVSSSYGLSRNSTSSRLISDTLARPASYFDQVLEAKRLPAKPIATISKVIDELSDGHTGRVYSHEIYQRAARLNGLRILAATKIATIPPEELSVPPSKRELPAKPMPREKVIGVCALLQAGVQLELFNNPDGTAKLRSILRDY